jgi:hypothetical protein
MQALPTVARVLAIGAGAYMVGATLLSALMTFVLPRGANVRITRIVFLTVRAIFDVIMPPRRDWRDRDRLFAMQAPVTLILLTGVWLVLVTTGFTAIYWGLGASLPDAYVTSGSSVFTLGFKQPHRIVAMTIAFVEAAIGIGLVALLVSYLPTIYSAFSRRETEVALLEAYAGSPPSAEEMLLRAYRIGGLERLEEIWVRWQPWFADIEESHTSLTALVFLRSPQPDRHWLTAAGVLLDTAALRASTIDLPRSADNQLCIRAGYVALRRIGAFFNFTYNPNPRPDDPISITREEYDGLYDRLVAAGLPIKPDREQAWRDFQGWRVNYDEVLRKLAGLTMVPPATWISDRVVPWHQPPWRAFVRRIR